MANERYTTGEVIEALKTAKGIKAHAAEILGCDRRTVDNYVNRHPTVAQAYEDLRETLVDRAERGLLNLLVKEEWQAIRYTLSTLGKDRGYTERYEAELSGKDGGPIETKITEVIVRIPTNEPVETDG